MKRKLFLVLILLTAFGATSVFAGGAVTSKPSPSLSDKAMGAADGSNFIPGLITTDFEAADTFAPGFCAGQNGWTAFVASTVEGHIDTANPAGGTQHLRVSSDPANATGTLTGCFSPDLGALPADNIYTTSVDVAITNANGADYGVVLQSPNQGFITARVNFRFTGPIQVFEGGDFVDTGATWTPGAYRNLTIVVNSTAGTIAYSYDGVLIHTGPLVGGTTVEQVVLFSDNWQVTDEHGDFDNLSTTRQTPTAIGLGSLEGNSVGALLPVLLLMGLLGGLTAWAVTKRTQ